MRELDSGAYYPTDEADKYWPHPDGLGGGTGPEI